MIDHAVDRMLPEWGEWCRRLNRSGGLGYAQVQYSEWVARASSATGWSPDCEPEIAELDALIRERLANPLGYIIISRYRDRLPDKAIAVKFGVTRSYLNRMLHLVVLPQLRHAWDCRNNSAIVQSVSTD